jgi:hypothetical protein
MNTFQMVVVGLGGLLGVSVFWGKIKDASMKLFTKKKKGDDVAPDGDGPHPHEPAGNSLAGVVLCWEELQRELKKRGLNKAAEELINIFPLFIERVEEDRKKEREPQESTHE